jgi:hypothetical protein
MPTVVEMLNKFLKREMEIGYENRTVIGGLAKFLPTWEKGTCQYVDKAPILEKITELINLYGTVPISERPAIANQLFISLTNLGAIEQTPPQQTKSFPTNFTPPTPK